VDQSACDNPIPPSDPNEDIVKTKHPQEMAPGYSEYNYPQPRARWGMAFKGSKVIRTTIFGIIIPLNR
jgi:hypothetical protein